MAPGCLLLMSLSALGAVLHRRLVEANRGIALFPPDIPQDLMGHLDITLECGGQTVTETLNVTSIS